MVLAVPRRCRTPSAPGAPPDRTSSAALELALDDSPSSGAGACRTRRCTSVCLPCGAPDTSRSPPTPPAAPPVEYDASLRLPSPIAIVFRCSGAQPVLCRNDDANAVEAGSRASSMLTRRCVTHGKLRVELTGLFENSAEPSATAAVRPGPPADQPLASRGALRCSRSDARL
jgi:hypothetical protein